MIKKVKTEQLRPGMFVEDFNCDWVGEYVFINQSMIKNEKAIEIINSWGIKEVYIDTERGLDVKDAKTAREIKLETDSDLHKLARKKRKTPCSPTPLKDEVPIARIIKKEAVDIMQQTMNSVLDGKQVDLGVTFSLVEKMERSVTRNKDALVMLARIRKKDEYTLIHSISVTSLILAYCNCNGISYERTINMATGALLHDIGKLKVPSKILNKPGKLNKEEFDHMKRHSEFSADILEGTKGLPEEAFDIALHHHERFDGTGYPHKLQGDAISYAARVTSICDVYDAITSARCYKEGIDRVEGLRKLYEWSNFHFDKELTYKFISCVGVYPVGTCVRLENGFTAVVTGSTENMLQPVVRIFYDNNKNVSTRIEEFDLSLRDINVASYDLPESWDNEKIEIFRKHSHELSPFH